MLELVGEAAEVRVVTIINKMEKKYFIGVGILIVLGFFLFNNFMGNAISGEDAFKISLSEISGVVTFYEVDRVEFFAVKALDGSIKTAFNACDVCYESHKGYRQEGDYMICNNCGNRYPVSGLGTENSQGGGCWPGYLENRVDGNFLVISRRDIIKGSYRF